MLAFMTGILFLLLKCAKNTLILQLGRLLGRCLGTLTETVLEALLNSTKMSSAAGTGGAAALGLHTPVVVAHGLGGETAGSAGLLLDVEGGLAATPAERVRLVVPFTKRLRTLRHCAWL